MKNTNKQAHRHASKTHPTTQQAQSQPQSQPQLKTKPPEPTKTTTNWYEKLHPIGKNEADNPNTQDSKKIFNLSLFFRIWLAVGIIIIIAGVVVFQQLFNYVRPVTQQVIEDTLVDTSKLLSINLQSALQTGEIYSDDYQAMLDTAFSTPNLPDKHSPYVSRNQLDILGTWYHNKTHSSFRVYVTDANGIVIYDSLPHTQEDGDFTNAEGKDYSRWRDVYLTLRGKYGARTTRKIAEDSTTSVMYVAQPIYAPNNTQTSQNHPNPQDKTIIGVVSVGKPIQTILPYLNATRQRMLSTSLIIVAITLLMTGLIAWWLKQSMLLVTRYTHSLAQDTKKPYFYLGRELNDLTDTIEDMKHRLENRAYVTDYVHTLTHELKSPLTAIRASGELLEAADLDNEDRLMLSQTITEQSIKLQSLIDRLLLLAKIEQPTFKLMIKNINIDNLITGLLTTYQTQRQYQKIDINYQCMIHNTKDAQIKADEFWLTQALQNLLDNALFFAQATVTIYLNKMTIDNKPFVQIDIFNDGALIPEYAIDKVFDRYFSLSHQHNPSTIADNTVADNTIANNKDINTDNKGINSQNYSNQYPNTHQHQSKKGTGLGLTLVKQVIERHDGQISITNITDSDDNQYHSSGVLVVILLPIYHTLS